MKIQWLVVLSVCVSLNTWAGDPQLVQRLSSHVFAPVGFDDNDNAQVVLDGVLPNTCYRVGPVGIRVDPVQHEITLQDQAYFFSDAFCLEVLVPYYKTVDLGLLKAAEYRVFVADHTSQRVEKALLKITTTKTPEPDEFLYLPVSEATVKKQAEGQWVLVMTGTATNTCMSLRDARVTYSPKRTIEVLPLAQMEGVNCHDENRTFEYSVNLNPVQTGKTLVHVRSLNGKAVNLVVEF